MPVGYPIGIEFDAGYNKLPRDMKTALIKEIATNFENRENYLIGDSANVLSGATIETLNKYRLQIAY